MADNRKPTQGESKPQGRVVLAPLITARFEDDRILYFRKGDVLPDGITEESLGHLASLGFISE